MQTAQTNIPVELQKDLNGISHWSTQNNVIINVKKTKHMFVIGKRLGTRLAAQTLPLMLNNENQVWCHKLLGINLDHDLSSVKHVEEVSRELSQRLGLQPKIKRFPPSGQRKQYYNAMIKQVILYGATIWANTTTEKVNKILQLQTRAARIILDADLRSNSVALFQKLNWLTFQDEVKVNKSILT